MFKTKVSSFGDKRGRKRRRRNSKETPKKFSRNWNLIAWKVEVVRSLKIREEKNSINLKRVIWKKKCSTSRSVFSPLPSIIFCERGPHDYDCWCKNSVREEETNVIVELAIYNQWFRANFTITLRWFNQQSQQPLNKITLRSLIATISGLTDFFYSSSGQAVNCNASERAESDSCIMKLDCKKYSERRRSLTKEIFSMKLRVYLPNLSQCPWS